MADYRTPKELVDMSVIQGRTLYPPTPIDFTKEFKPLKAMLAKAGGTWVAKIQGFKFESDVKAQVSVLFGPPTTKPVKTETFEQNFLF